MQKLPAFRPHSVTADKLPGVSPVVAPALWRLRYPAGTASVLWLGGTTRQINGAALSERGEGGPCKASARAGPKYHQHEPPCRFESSEGRALCEQRDLGEGWSHVVQGSVSSGLQPIHLHTSHRGAQAV